MSEDQVAADHARNAAPDRFAAGADYFFVAPEDFTRVEEKDPSRQNLANQFVRGEGKFTDVILVWVGPPTRTVGVDDPELHRKNVWTEALAPYVQKVEVVPTTDQLDGHPLLHFRGVSTYSPRVVDVLVAEVNDRSYKIDMTLSMRHTADERSALIRQVVQSWRWARFD